MSQPLSIVHESSHGFNEFGQVSESRESYIKVSTSFRRGPLAFFSGAQLKVFLCIALHEADDEPGVSLTAIMHECSLSKPTVIDSLSFLSDKAHPFINRDGTGTDNAHIWRVSNFAWVGGGKKILPPKKKFLHHDDDDLDQPDSVKTSSSSFMSKEIFSKAGFAGANLVALSQNVEPATAQAWADWVGVCDRSVYRNPHGYAWKCLIADPTTQPPATRKQKTWMDGFEQFVQR